MAVTIKHTIKHNNEELPAFLKKAIEGEIKIATELELDRAKERIEKMKSEIIAGVVLHVTKMIEMQTLENKLIVTIKTS